MKSTAKTMNKETTEQPGSSLDRIRIASIFSKLSEQEISPFKNAAQVRSYKKGKVLYLQEEPAEFFYVICSGWVKLFHTMPEGDEVVVDMLTAGDMVGESATFEKGLHTSSAQVIEAVQLLSIPSRVLKEQIRLNPSLALGMLASMFKHHRRHYDAIALNAMQSAPQRVGCFLLRLCPIGEKRGITFHLPYDKTLIAYTLGMKGATFSRAFNILRQKTGVHMKGTRIEIDSIEPLMKYVYGSLAAKYEPEDM
jgi:CRP-like cAMP-binding protein